MEGQPIVVKRIKKHVHGAHGGSWKVAFADFVTAMMAFFMVMWLTSSSTPEQKAAISKYFNDPYGIAPHPSAIQGPGGSSTSQIPSTGNVGTSAGAVQVSSANENPEQPETSTALSAMMEMAREQERKILEELKKELEKAIEASVAMAPFKDQLLIDIGTDGLRVQIVDKENRPMFDLGSPVLEDYASNILHELAKSMAAVPNRISISGHTDATPYSNPNGNYSNWELSADRANAARRALLEGGLPEDKVARVIGLSSSVLFDKANSFNPINRRISIIVMTKAAEENALKSEENTQPPPASKPH